MGRVKLTYAAVVLRPKKRVHPKGLFDSLFGDPLMRGAFKKISRHGLVPVVLGAAVIIEGHSAMQIRSTALMVCAAWLAADIGAEISDKNWGSQVKAIIFCFATCLSFCAAMVCMYWFLLSTLEDQQVDEFQNPDGMVALPPSGYVLDSTFAVRNNGKTAIGPHQVSCVINRFSSYKVPGPDIEITASRSTIIRDSQVSLEPGGDAQSDACLSIFINPEATTGAKCADITLQMFYVLETQPTDVRHKEFRFLAKRVDGFTWHRQPLGMPVSPCNQM